MTDASDPTEFVHTTIPLAATLAIEVLTSEPGEVRARLQHRMELTTGGGVLHGGVIMALADTTGAVCAFNNLPAGAGTTTIESKTNFLGAVRDGYVEAVSHPLHVGRTTIVVDTDVYDARGKRVARVTQTQAVLSS